MITPPYTPELLEDARTHVEAYLAGINTPTVLEFGAGWSTVWFAQQGATVVSLEHDFAWWLDVSRAMKLLGKNELVALLEPERFRDFVCYLPFNSFDLVYVDCVDSQRNACTLAACNRVRVGGRLVLDDTHWDAWKPTLEQLPSRGFAPTKVFEGMHTRKDRSVHRHHTTILKRLR